MVLYRNNSDRTPRIFEQHDNSYIFEGQAFFFEKRPTILQRVKRRLRK